MNPAALVNSGIRFVLLLILQVFLLQQIRWGWGGKEYLFLFLYPLFVALLPLRMSRGVVMLLGFALGLIIDFFYETLGMHAAALTFTGYFRFLVLRILEPRDGYNIKDNPSSHDLGQGWMLKYLALLFLGHCVFFFSVQAFSFVFLSDILLRSAFTFVPSYLVAVLVMLIFNPRS